MGRVKIHSGKDLLRKICRTKLFKQSILKIMKIARINESVENYNIGLEFEVNERNFNKEKY